MKASTLQSFAYSNSSGDDSTWKLLDAIAKSAGDDVAKGKKAVLDFIVAFGLRSAISAYFDKNENIDREIRRKLSNLNEEYPFDVVEASQQVKVLFNQYINLTAGVTSYSDTMTMMTTLRNMAQNNETPEPEPTPEQIHAWDYLY